jgi:uncharacterized GH25 family protein
MVSECLLGFASMHLGHKWWVEHFEQNYSKGVHVTLGVIFSSFCLLWAHVVRRAHAVT